MSRPCRASIPCADSPPLRGATNRPAAPAVITRAAHPVAADRALAEGRRVTATAL